MIVHWFIEPVSYGKESASDIENPFENKKCATQFCYKTLETDFKELRYLQITKTILHKTF